MSAAKYSLRRWVAVLSFGCLLAATWPGVASAHVLRTDGSITAELHIEPYDHPLSGEPTHYQFEFTDTAGQFKLANCDCRLTITQGATITTQTLAVTGSSLSKDTYTFPKPGSYTLHLTGTPKKAGQFQPFSLQWPVQVAAGAVPAKSFSVWIAVAVGAGIVALIGAAFIMERGSGKKTAKS